jgi:hypothetical protein
VSLIKIVAILAIIGVVVFDTGAVIVNHVQLDDVAQTTLRTTAQSARTGADRRPAALTQAAEQALDQASERAELVEVTLESSRLRVTVRQDAQVLLLDRLGPLADLATAEVTKATELEG